MSPIRIFCRGQKGKKSKSWKTPTEVRTFWHSFPCVHSQRMDEPCKLPGIGRDAKKKKQKWQYFEHPSLEGWHTNGGYGYLGKWITFNNYHEDLQMFSEKTVIILINTIYLIPSFSQPLVSPKKKKTCKISHLFIQHIYWAKTQDAMTMTQTLMGRQEGNYCKSPTTEWLEAEWGHW